ncbi:hypothetical protein [Sphingopyxis sp. P1IMeth2]|uniref:hypothetical protein n=1 Tax=Sphingopyxis sp. P1IMeth2 TaxID=1892848 RepID=UPI001644EA6A|nr:hypothetical protein [Sphingopyxis sp. P1IMeth2]
MRIVGFLFSLGPILFGIGFLAPVIASVMGAAGLDAPVGLSAIQFGLITGIILGVIARQRKTWLW